MTTYGIFKKLNGHFQSLVVPMVYGGQGENSTKKKKKTGYATGRTHATQGSEQ